MTPRPAITPEKATTPSPALNTAWPTTAAKSTPRCPDDHWLWGCSNGRRRAGRGDSGQTKPLFGETRGATAAGPVAFIGPVGLAVVAAVRVEVAVGVGAPVETDVVAGRRGSTVEAAAADRATTAMRAADAAGVKSHMRQGFLSPRPGDTSHGQPVNNAAGRHTPVDLRRSTRGE